MIKFKKKTGWELGDAVLLVLFTFVVLPAVCVIVVVSISLYWLLSWCL